MRKSRSGWFIVVALPLLWLLGLFYFITQIPNSPSEDAEPTDAIVVLTGGSGRVEAGFALWTQGRAKKLFISGVGKGVNLKEIYRLAGHETPVPLAKATPASPIVLGYEAASTRGNAKETAEWMAKEGFTSARLVTANYHIPRSLMEFRHAMPGVRFVPEPVLSTQVHAQEWWRYPGTARLILSEYNKSVASAIDHSLHAWLPWLPEWKIQ